MMTFNFKSNTAEVMRQLSDLQKKKLPEASRRALSDAGRYVAGALRSELKETIDRPTAWVLRGLRYRAPSASDPVARIWLEDVGGRPSPSKVLTAQITGGTRRLKRFEIALQARGLMPPGTFAVPGAQAPLDANGNVSASFVNRMLSDLKAFGGARGQRSNRKGARRGARKTNYFFAPPPGSSLKPGIYWHMPGGLLGVAFIFVSRVSYQKRFDFYGVGRRAFDRISIRMMTAALRT